MEALRDALNLTRPLVSPLLISDGCFDSLVLDLNVADTLCLKETLSKVAGYGIIVMATVLKLPLILNILKARSVDGLSTTSVYLETSMYVAVLVYHAMLGSPFSTYGEKYVLLAQNMVIVGLIVYYGRKGGAFALASAAGLAVVTVGMLSLPPEMRPLLILYSSGGAVFARSPQIYANFVNGHTGVLALSTLAVSVGGGLVRLLTVIQEVGEPVAILGEISPLFFNSIILAQIIWYRKSTAEHFAKYKRE
ncbi:Mannose-P-dolichol utilization defect 1 protein [Hondaea fermentalgiana]|uniref:Mannose-P-dolichol utilization defect 1 protein homolog n=1 Tax=Hondaea fermentalgiana TaxID=2315210 RepID=A0A2R5G6X0_9STRA|nr:Mannose-P-dolichol utilization defect 1 protein [Hondaea fermentalgiana]|eukprot:GBG26807.1 Mannose-P-dolichol utilization defect 1 protein [Hondaea fermentalgiana]